MANNFRIVISAVDQATAVVRKVNQSFGLLSRPIAEVKSAVAAFDKEAGFARVAKSLVEVGQAAAEVGRKIAGIAAPLAAVVGISSIAAVSALADEWSRAGGIISRAADATGVTTDRLQSLGGAARLVGGSAEALRGGLKGLGDTMEDALFGRNQEALALFSRLGIALRDGQGNVRNAADVFLQLADALARVKNPQVQNVIARTFGLEEVLPLLRKGGDGIRELEERIRGLGGVMSGAGIARATEFEETLGLLNTAIVGVRDAIGDRLIPILRPMIEHWTELLGANREFIAANVAEFIGAMAEAFNGIDWRGVIDGVKTFVADTKSLIESTIGWKGAAIALGLVLAGPLLAAVGSLTTAVVTFGTALLANPVVAIATAIAGAGILIYRNWDTLGEFFEKLWRGVVASFDWAWGKIKPIVDAVGSGIDLLRKVWPFGGGAAATSVPAQPAAPVVSVPLPAAAGAAVPTPSAAVAAASANARSSGGAAAAQQVQVEVTFKDAPQGLRAETKVDNGAVASTRIDYAMPTFVTP